MKAIFAIILAVIGVYVGVNLLPGLNSTVATITTPTYGVGVVGMIGVVMIVVAAMLVSKNATLNSNVHRISCQIRGKLNSVMSKLITELNQRMNLGNCGETRRQPSFNRMMV